MGRSTAVEVLGLAVAERKPYKTDLTDAEWAVIEPLDRGVEGRASLGVGRSARYAMREIVDALRCQDRTAPTACAFATQALE